MENMDWKTFTAIPNGTKVLNHGWDQCVALANLYHEDVIGGAFVPVPSAYMWWTRFGEFPQLTQNYTPRSTPVAGAIFVSRYGLYDAPNGHIGVVTSVNSNGTFTTMEQNAGVWRYVGRYTRDMTNMLGFLHPKNNPATNTPNTEVYSEEEDDEMKPTVHVRTEGGTEYMRASPEIGHKLKPGAKRVDGKVTVFRGYEVTTDENIGAAWARTHTRGVGGETSRTNRSGYIEIQRQAQRLSVETYG